MEGENAEISSFLVNDADFLCLDLVVDARPSDSDLAREQETHEEEAEYDRDDREGGSHRRVVFIGVWILPEKIGD